MLVIRGEKSILDSDLAELYGVETRCLNEQVYRDIDKFPEDFMFQLTKEEFANLNLHFHLLLCLARSSIRLECRVTTGKSFSI